MVSEAAHDPPYSWDASLTVAKAGVVEGERDVYILLDAEGEEVDQVTQAYYGKTYMPATGKGGGKGEGGGEPGQSRAKAMARRSQGSGGESSLSHTPMKMVIPWKLLD